MIRSAWHSRNCAVCPTRGSPKRNGKPWQALLELLPVAVAQFLKVGFQQGGEADFTEMSMAAQRALGEAEEPTGPGAKSGLPDPALAGR